MKPHRIRMTHNLLVNYGLYRKMQIYRAARTSQDDMTRFHSDDYIKFLKHIRPDNMNDYQKQMQRFNVGEGPGRHFYKKSKNDLIYRKMISTR